MAVWESYVKAYSRTNYKCVGWLCIRVLGEEADVLLKGAENFQYNSFRSNLSELTVYVANAVLILIRSSRNSQKFLPSTYSKDFQLHVF